MIGGNARRDPSPKYAHRCLGRVDDSNQLEIGIAERYYPVRGAPLWVTSALDRCKAVTEFHFVPGRCQVCHSHQHVVDLHPPSVMLRLLSAHQGSGQGRDQVSVCTPVAVVVVRECAVHEYVPWPGS